jgi:hypothetical protein
MMSGVRYDELIAIAATLIKSGLLRVPLVRKHAPKSPTDEPAGICLTDSIREPGKRPLSVRVEIHMMVQYAIQKGYIN